MRTSPVLSAALFVCALAAAVSAQSPALQPAPDERGAREPRVALSEAATAYDIAGRAAVGGRLRTQQLAGSQDAPVRNVLVVVENRGGVFYNYASGWASFYDAAGVRCGEGLWKTEALAPGEMAEVDTPGLRLTCAPATWRLTALNLITRSSDIAKPDQPLPPAAGTLPPADAAAQPAGDAAAAVAPQRLEININGKTLPLQLNNPVEIVVGKERVLIVVRPAP